MLRADDFEKVILQVQENVFIVFKLTLLQLIVHNHQEGHSNHEEVKDEADLTQLANSRPAHMLDHRLVSALATDGGRVAQDDQTTDEEHKGDLKIKNIKIQVRPPDGAKVQNVKDTRIQASSNKIK